VRSQYGFGFKSILSQGGWLATGISAVEVGSEYRACRLDHPQCTCHLAQFDNYRGICYESCIIHEW
jgi:ribulose bisphosphate carboxylase small subunit